MKGVCLDTGSTPVTSTYIPIKANPSPKYGCSRNAALLGVYLAFDSIRAADVDYKTIKGKVIAFGQPQLRVAA